jgi:hypothetical protein
VPRNARSGACQSWHRGPRHPGETAPSRRRAPNLHSDSVGGPGSIRARPSARLRNRASPRGSSQRPRPHLRSTRRRRSRIRERAPGPATRRFRPSAPRAAAFPVGTAEVAHRPHVLRRGSSHVVQTSLGRPGREGKRGKEIPPDAVPAGRDGPIRQPGQPNGPDVVRSYLCYRIKVRDWGRDRRPADPVPMVGQTSERAGAHGSGIGRAPSRHAVEVRTLAGRRPLCSSAHTVPVLDQSPNLLTLLIADGPSVRRGCGLHVV